MASRSSTWVKDRVSYGSCPIVAFLTFCPTKFELDALLMLYCCLAITSIAICPTMFASSSSPTFSFSLLNPQLDSRLSSLSLLLFLYVHPHLSPIHREEKAYLQIQRTTLSMVSDLAYSNGSETSATCLHRP
ncbi:hypothetical protein PIB30_026197 [Stylosanthes scabra]|uniref:Uncharacterized protein n=1 Tax=Stylosanthes scabra TaxID=79078 RepID=A0ABU6YAG0_9FABA|nr:hypothetical protein [Stylosanthes scabra]